MYGTSTTPSRIRPHHPVGRHRSLSLEESAQSNVLEEDFSDLGIVNPEKECVTPHRRRLNTYLNAKESLPTQRSLEEASEEDGPFSESLPGTTQPAPATNMFARLELAFFNFLQRHPCYELMPSSSKLVVFDTRLCGRKAFFAMMHNGVSAALLWNTEKQTFVGVLTVCDFIRAVCHQYTDGGPILEEQCVEAWLQYDTERKRMVAVAPEDSIARAASLLLSSRIRRLPVCDPSTGNILCLIAHKHIVRLVYANLSKLGKPRYWFQPLREIGVGTFVNLATATPQTKIIDALQLLIDRHVSALPVVAASDGRLLGVFSRTDALALAADKAYLNLGRPLSSIMPHLCEELSPNSTPIKISTCTLDVTFGVIVERVVRNYVHRLIVIDSSRKVIGIVSLTDILRLFIRAPPSSHTIGSLTTMASPVPSGGFDIFTPTSLDHYASTSASFLSADSPATFLARTSNGNITPSIRSHHLSSVTPVYNSGRGDEMVSASLPSCPGPACSMAFAEISS